MSCPNASDLQKESNGDSCATLQVGVNDKHEYLQKLLDRKKRSHGSSNPETNGPFKKMQRKSGAFCTNNFEHEPNSDRVELQSEEAEQVASCKIAR